MVEDVTPRVSPLPFGPTSGSFFTSFAACALPLVVVPVPDVEVPPVVVLCAAAPVPLAPTAIIPSTATPQSHVVRRRLTTVPPISVRNGRASPPLSPQVRLLHEGVVPDLVGCSLSDHAAEV